VRGLRAALSYFTILPVGASAAPDAAALAWLPFVGALTGAIAGAAAYGVALRAPHALAVATAFGLSIVLTGAIHLDGFLDGCDAFFASTTPERRLEILKDPRHGTFALAGFGVLAVLWLAALWSLPAAFLPLALAFAAAAARWSAIVHALWIPYGRSGAPPRAFEARLPAVGMLLGLALVVALAFALDTAGLRSLAVAFALGGICVLWIRGRLGGGLVGDAYGFTIVVAETGALVAIAIGFATR
jgi:adenosylcobinamide-GDP ribazoletransferase